jgi:hypothetical protein
MFEFVFMKVDPKPRNICSSTDNNMKLYESTLECKKCLPIKIKALLNRIIFMP